MSELGHSRRFDDVHAILLYPRLCCKTLFGSLKTNFPGCGRSERIIVWGTAATGDELTGNFGSALEGTLTGNCRLFGFFAEKSLQAIFGVLQYNPLKSGHSKS